MSQAETTYPVARFLARHGTLLALSTGAALFFLGLWALHDGAAWWTGAALMGGGVLGFILLKSYCELVAILLDILLPQ